MPDELDQTQSNTDVYAIHGAEPEVLAYAMAKYSRSSLTLRESLAEISAQKAEQFLNTFYFAYGHRSIADLAHIPMAVERLSLLAAIALVDEQRWDGQERSTRYQDFRRSVGVVHAGAGIAGRGVYQRRQGTVRWVRAGCRWDAGCAEVGRGLSREYEAGRV